jgi:hypothetical protein
MNLTYELDEPRLTFLQKVASLDLGHFLQIAEHLRSLPSEERLELAIACGNEAAKHSQDFGADQAGELRVLKALARNASTAKGITETKEQLHSLDSQDRLELAWACITASTIDTGDDIMNFDILGEVERFRLAREYVSSADFSDLGNLGNLAKFELQESHFYDILALLARFSYRTRCGSCNA